MTTITANDIRAELDAMNEPDEPVSYVDVAAFRYGPCKPVWAVVGKGVNMSYAIDGAVYGIYESKDLAERVASAMSENARLDYERGNEWDLFKFEVVELSLNDHPDPVINWHYYE